MGLAEGVGMLAAGSHTGRVKIMYAVDRATAWGVNQLPNG